MKKLRKEHGYSQEQFAEITNHSVDFISMVERGINAPSVEGCQRVAVALQVSLPELFDFDSPPKVTVKWAKETARAKKKRKVKGQILPLQVILDLKYNRQIAAFNLKRNNPLT